jgi:SAM-dependent methyltransferase
VLDTGAGPGKHTAVLCLLGAHVTAVDLLASNVNAIEQLKAKRGFVHLAAHQADLMQALPADWPAFDLISAHNWMHHAENPGTVLSHLARKLKVGGRLYLSLYQSGTFRFLIAQIARSVAKWSDHEVVKELIPLFFPAGFLEFNNPDEIHFENILDDFFVPYQWPLRYEPLIHFLQQLGFEILTRDSSEVPLQALDHTYLKLGLLKVSERDAADARLEFRNDEFDTSCITDEHHRLIVQESVEWARRAIDALRALGDHEAYLRAAFCLGLYRLRGTFSRSQGVEARHLALQEYLKRFVSGDTSAIRSWESAKRYYSTSDENKTSE